MYSELAPNTTYASFTTTSGSGFVYRISVKPGVNGTSSSPKQISVDPGAAYCTTVQPASSTTIEV